MIKLFSFLAALSLFALPTDVGYARIESGALLYRLSDGVYTKVCTLPEGYHVAVISETDDSHFLVSYADITGYIQSADLKQIDGIPKQKYADCRYLVDNDSQPANLRSRPNKDGEIVCVMPSGSGGKIIGTIEGDELIGGAGKLWYYVRYEEGNNITYGYAYCAHISAEGFGVCSSEVEPKAESAVQNGQDKPKSEMSLPVKILIISALCAPLVVVACLLRPKKKAET